MPCCLNPDCQNPLNPDGTTFCLSCGIKLVLLRNRYRIIQPLGGGGFGRTFLAEDVDKLDERCVVKQFAPQVQGSSALQKATNLFEQEARRLQQLGEHPQIPTLYAYFEEDKRLYLVQQLILGQNLLQELERQGVFNEQKIRELLSDLLPILQSIHEQQVIHRDIKPENIIRRHSDRKLVLIDFGVAKLATATAMAKTGTSIGSFGYAPIEQMRGGEAYRASDLYSLGVTCFHLLTGIDPWQLWTDRGYSWVYDWHYSLETPVSQQLEAILSKLLQKDVSQRYSSAPSVLSDLNQKADRPVAENRKRTRSPSERPTKAQNSRQSSRSTVPSTVALPVEAKRSLPAPKKHSFKITLLMSFILMFFGLGAYGYWKLRPFIASVFASDWRLISISTQNQPESENSTIQPTPSPTTETDVSADEPQPTPSPTTETDVSANAVQPPSSPIEQLESQKQPFKPNYTPNKVFSYENIALANTLEDDSGWITSVAISPDSQTLVSGSWGKTIKIWDLSTNGTLKSTLEDDTGSVGSVAISPDGQTLVSGGGSFNNTIKIWDLSTGSLKSTLTKGSGAVCLGISPDSQTLVSASGNTIKIWDLSTGKLKSTIAGHSDAVKSIAISPDGRTLVSGSSDNTIKIWDLRTSKLKNVLAEHSGAVNSVAISPDGQILVSGSSDSTIKIWDLSTDIEKSTLQGHSGTVNSVAISPDGQTLISSSDDHTIKIWDLSTDSLKTSSQSNYGAVKTIAISPDGRTLVTNTRDNTIQLWQVLK